MKVTILKKLNIIILLVATILFLSACSGNKVPYGSIGDTIVYGDDSGSYSVTEKELYEKMRFVANNELLTAFKETIFKVEYEEIDELITKATTSPATLEHDDKLLMSLLDSSISTSIWGSADYPTLKAISKNEDQLKVKLQTFIDNYKVLNPSDNETDSLYVSLSNSLKAYVANPLNEKSEKLIKNYVVFGYSAKVLSYFKTNILDYKFALNFLEADIKNEDSSSFIKESDLVSYYDNNLKEKGDVDAFVIPFFTSNEANTILQKYNLKSNSRGEWFEIPDPRVLTDVQLQSNDYKYVDDILKDLDIKKTTVDYKRISETDYAQYYDRYSISTNRPNNPDTALTDAGVLKYFIQMYADVNGLYKDGEGGPQDDTVQWDELDLKFEIDEDTLEYVGTHAVAAKEVFRRSYKFEETQMVANSSLRSHLWTTLMLPTPEAMGNKRYSARVQSFSNYNYLVFKFTGDSTDSVKEEDFIISKEDENGSEIRVFNIDGEKPSTFEGTEDEWNLGKQAIIDAAKSWRGKAWDPVRDQRFTSTYATSLVNKVWEDSKIYVYDWVVKIFFERANTSFTVDKKKYDNKENLGRITVSFKDLKDDYKDFTRDKIDVKIKVDDIFAKMMKQYGPSTSADIAFDKYLQKTYGISQKKDGSYVSDGSKISKEEMDEFKENYKNVMTNFSNDQQASNGFPASMGRANYVLVALQATNNFEGLYNSYIGPKLQELFKKDYVRHYGEGIYQKFADLSKDVRDSLFGVGASHILVYVDEDLDGNPDDPKDYLDGKDSSKIKELISGLISQVYQLIGNNLTITGGIEAIISEYEQVTRAIPSYKTIISEVNLPSKVQYDRWAKYKQAGLFLKYETLESINQDTNMPAAATYDKDFYNRVEYLNKHLDQYVGKDYAIATDNAIFPYLDSYGGGVWSDVNPKLLDNVQSSFGWHFILLTSREAGKSSASTKKEDSASNYVSDFTDLFGNPLNAYSYTPYLTADQIQIYLQELGTTYGVEHLPSSVNDAINNYFTPIKTLYDGEQFQREIEYKILDEVGAKFKGYYTSYTDIVEAMRDVNKHNIFSYNDIEDLSLHNVWARKFGRIFDVLENDKYFISAGSSIFASNLKTMTVEQVGTYTIPQRDQDFKTNYAEGSYRWDGTVIAAKGIYKLEAINTGTDEVIGQYFVKVTDGSAEVSDYAYPSITTSDLDKPVSSNRPDTSYLFKWDKIEGDITQDEQSAKINGFITNLKSKVTASDGIDGNLTDVIFYEFRYVNWTIAGDYNVILTVSDSTGNTTTEVININIAPEVHPVTPAA